MKKFYLLFCFVVGVLELKAIEVEKQSTEACRIESARVIEKGDRVEIRGQSRRTMSLVQQMGAHLDVAIANSQGSLIKSIRVPFGVITPRQDSINNYRSVFSAEFSKKDFAGASRAIVKYCSRSDCI